MNWIDAVLIVLLLVSVIIGSKKGLVRELTAFVVVFVAVIISLNYIDQLAVWVHDKTGGSPLISAFLAFVILLAATYATFKLVAMLFYKVANIKQIGKKDQMGGALVGFLRGWIAIGFLTFLVFLLPLPDGFYTSFENSFFGPTVAKTVPLMFESTSALHKKTGFMEQMEKTLLVAPSKNSSQDIMDEERVEAHRALYQLERFFNTGTQPGA
jgi:membrane protein required for colicin V production